MVSKKTSGAKKTPAESKKTSAVKKTTAARAADSKTVDKQIPFKENIDPVKEVLEIKAHNDEKKQAKAAKKSVKAATLSTTNADVSEKGAKAVSNRKKVMEIKDNAQKSAAKKFAANKEGEGNVSERVSEGCCCRIREAFTTGFFAAWGRAYRHIFDFKGRTSRYEFWAFMLLNFIIITPIFLTTFSYLFQSFYTGQELNGFWLAGLIALSLIEAVVYLSLFVRRLHDTGCGAWRGFFRPLLISGVLAVTFSVVSDYILPEESELTAENLKELITSFIFSLCFLVILLTYLYYSIKVFIAAGFYEEEAEDNAYGVACYCDCCHKVYGLRYATLYFVLLVLFYALIRAISLFLFLGAL